MESIEVRTKRWLEEEEAYEKQMESFKPEPVPSDKLEPYGWVLKSGLMYCCRREGHRELAEYIIYHFYKGKEPVGSHGSAERALELLGAIKCGSSYLGGLESFFYYVEDIDYRMPAQQKKTVQNWCINQGVEFCED